MKFIKKYWILIMVVFLLLAIIKMAWECKINCVIFSKIGFNLVRE